MSRWYKLDNAAKLFPTVTGTKYSSVFRVSAVMIEDVNGEILQKTVDHIYERFPMMFLKIRRGVFWNYFDTNRDKFVVQEESGFPCAMINPYENNGYLLKILYFGKRISVEIFHSLTDGGGAFEFFKTLLFYYINFSKHNIDSEGNVILMNDTMSSSEMEDSFSRYYQPTKSMKQKTQKSGRSFRIRGTSFGTFGNNVITGVLSANDINNLAKSKNATITSYLASLLIYSIYIEQQKHSLDKAPIVIAVPVNLRKIFPSKTLRNFFAVVNVGTIVDDSVKLDNIIEEISIQLKSKTEKHVLQTFIADNVSLEKRIYSRFVPLLIKKILIMIGSYVMGASRKTITISNVGRIAVPKGFFPVINHMAMTLYPTPKSPINCAVCSFGDKLAISFSRTIVEAGIIKHFFSSLAEDSGLDVEVYSNDWGLEHE